MSSKSYTGTTHFEQATQQSTAKVRNYFFIVVTSGSLTVEFSNGLKVSLDAGEHYNPRNHEQLLNNSITVTSDDATYVVHTDAHNIRL